jgi:hypothetical protein
MRAITACQTLVMTDRCCGCKSYKDSFGFLGSGPELATTALTRFAAAGLLYRSCHRKFRIVEPTACQTCARPPSPIRAAEISAVARLRANASQNVETLPISRNLSIGTGFKHRAHSLRRLRDSPGASHTGQNIVCPRDRVFPPFGRDRHQVSLVRSTKLLRIDSSLLPHLRVITIRFSRWSQSVRLLNREGTKDFRNLWIVVGWHVNCLCREKARPRLSLATNLWEWVSGRNHPS